MSVTLTSEAFRYSELSDDAKRRARERWAETESQFFGDTVDFDDFEQVAAILGVRFQTHSVRLMNGSTRQEPNIYWSGFSSQGDGLCFEGFYSYAKGSAKRIREYAPQDVELHHIADALAAAQKPFLYGLEATVEHRGRYYHEHSVSIEVVNGRNEWQDIGRAADDIAEALRDLMRWQYRQLESEYEYRLSDEAIEESIEANEPLFTAEGDFHPLA